MGGRRKIAFASVGLIVLIVVAVVVALPDDGRETVRVVVKQGSVGKPEPGEALARGEEAAASFETNLGSFEVTLDGKGSPIAANNFAYLVKSGFYDGLGFHRIVPDFVIQGGDPRGNGSGGPGYRVVDRPDQDVVYGPGTVAMAKASTDPRGSSGSQFFVVTAERPVDLPADYAIVGRVSAGWAVVKRIGSFGGPDERPTRTIVIERARLID